MLSQPAATASVVLFLSGEMTLSHATGRPRREVRHAQIGLVDDDGLGSHLRTAAVTNW